MNDINDVVNQLNRLNTDLIQVTRELTSVNKSFQRLLMDNYDWKHFIADNASLSWSGYPDFKYDDIDLIKERSVDITLRSNVIIVLKDYDNYVNYGDYSVGVYYTRQFDSYNDLLEKLEKYKLEKYHFYTGNIEPSEDTIFVFGSNPEGRHGAGAAKIAREKFGAQYGNGYGIQGNSYAIVTKDLRISEVPSIKPYDIIKQIRKMYDYANEHPNLKFKVAYRNELNQKSLCGYTGHQLLDMFINKSYDVPQNVYFSEEWYRNINYVLSNPIHS